MPGWSGIGSSLTWIRPGLRGSLLPLVSVWVVIAVMLEAKQPCTDVLEEQTNAFVLSNETLIQPWVIRSGITLYTQFGVLPAMPSVRATRINPDL